MRSTIGEALAAGAAVIGFSILVGMGALQSWDNVWMFAVALGIIVLFYALMLLCRAVFHFMTGSEKFWWEKYEEKGPKKTSGKK